jgi:4-pyridoxate dehydrogenase
MYDWGYQSVPQRGLGGRRVELMRGKVLGGSSSVNFLAHNRGNRSDYARWAARLGMPEWSYDALLPYFKRSESWLGGQAPRTAAAMARWASAGPVATIRSRRRYWTPRVLAGHPVFDDLNEPKSLMASASHNRRSTGAAVRVLRAAYLRPSLSRSQPDAAPASRWRPESRSAERERP